MSVPRHLRHRAVRLVSLQGVRLPRLDTKRDKPRRSRYLPGRCRLDNANDASASAGAITTKDPPWPHATRPSDLARPLAARR